MSGRVKVRRYADGSHAVFHGPRCIGRYDPAGAEMAGAEMAGAEMEEQSKQAA